MGILNSLRPIQRMHDGIQIRLRLEDWPANLPLPAGSTVVGIGENHEELVYPYWRFVLESDCTLEALFGWFRTPLPFEDTLTWYRGELSKLGWIEHADKDYLIPPRAGLKFQHPETKERVSISIQWWPALNETTAMVRRVRKHPHSPPAPEPAIPAAKAERNGNTDRATTGTVPKPGDTETHAAPDDLSSDAEARSEWQRGIDLVVKVSDIFKELAGGRAANLYPTHFPYEVRDAIRRALASELDEQTAGSLALHLVDWNSEAAFLVALLLFPERFTPDEIREGVAGFLIHAPNHVAAAAQLGGWPSGDRLTL